MAVSREALEAQLNDFDPQKRREALAALLDMAASGKVTFPEPKPIYNLHCHTFFSYNGYGYSPSALAWLAKTQGWSLAGTIDFDVLDAVDEFLEACRLLRLKGTSGLETRVFIPEFGERVINSPGEPGVAYHMGVGFTSSGVSGADFLASLKQAAQKRNQDIMERVNPFLSPVEVDYDRDLLPLSPKGNPTERHLCAAYESKAREVFPDAGKRAAFFAEKLGVDCGELEPLMDGPSPKLQALIRSKTMKRGGPGYVQPDTDAFPRLGDFNAFTLNEGAVPTFAFLDGTTDGEQAMDELLNLMMESGVAAVNIIPDRNWNISDTEVKKTKVANLHAFVEAAVTRDLPVIVGTEMNAYGQKLIDDFDAPELKPVVPYFLRGAHAMYAHTVLQALGGLGLLSPWAKKNFDTPRQRNAFYEKLGEEITPLAPGDSRRVDESMPPDSVRAALGL